MHYLLHALVCIDYEYVTRYGAPPLYRSGVRYDNARAGKPEWQDIPTTIKRGKGDCKDLACWLVAEDWTHGVRSRPYIRYRTRQFRGDDGQMHDFSLYHVLVERPGGVLEDPSARLGMGQDEWTPMTARAIGRAGEGARGAVERGRARRCHACGGVCACGNWCCCAGGACAGPRVAVGSDGIMEVWHWADPFDLPRLDPASAWTEVDYKNPRNIERGDEEGYLPASLTAEGIL